MRDKCAQQEIVGFVLIVVLVVIGLMFFLLYSFKADGDLKDDDLVLGNLMSSIMHYTTSCSVDGSDQTVLDLFANCYNGDGCDNKEETSCDLLNSELGFILEAAYKTEGSVNGLSFDFYMDDELGIRGVQGFEKLFVGNCTGDYYRSFEQPVGSLDDVYVLLSAC
jgi:hypothetical protein